MELTRKQTKQLQGIAILLMFGLHLFNRADFAEKYNAHFYFFGKPILLYISYVFDACVPIYLFCSGYGYGYKSKNGNNSIKSRIKRLIPFIEKYWVVIVLTCIVGNMLGMQEQYPGDIGKFLVNIFLLKNSYVGALWFAQIYVILVLLSNWIYKVINKNINTYIIIGISGIIYVGAFVIEYVVLPCIGNIGFNSVLYTLMLICRSQFAFVFGMLVAARRMKVSYKFVKVFSEHQVIALCIFWAVVIIRGCVCHMIFAPFSAYIILLLFLSVSTKLPLESIFIFLGKHSTNMWMTHMQVYMIFAPSFVFWTKNALVVYVTLVVCTLIISYILDCIMKVLNQIRETFFKNRNISFMD